MVSTKYELQPVISILHAKKILLIEIHHQLEEVYGCEKRMQMV